MSALSTVDLSTVLALAGLGAFHGLNPGMGWLFAVALGLQQRSRTAVLKALGPIALGHEASVAVAILLVGGLELVASAQPLRLAGAVALLSFGVYKLLRPNSHFRWVGFRLGAKDLFVWSFLMSSAHGAGLMLFPLVLGSPEAVDAAAVDLPEVRLGAETLLQDLAAAALHSAAMLVAMGAIALIVYERVGVAFLRHAWINLDLPWAVALMGAGLFTVFS